MLKARMNADLHSANELKNTGKGNVFVIFGEQDVEVVYGQWLVTSGGRKVVSYEQRQELSELEAWKKSIDWVEKIYNVSKTFPPVERFGLTRPESSVG